MKFSEWLDANPKMSVTLREALSVGKASISNVKTGHRPMPKRWIPILVRLSRKKLTFESLLTEMLSAKRTPDSQRRKPK